ncbi:MAG TPA: polysaccharide deacetylase family protein [Anaerolineaceae bacterium]|nr:polysaccharide deacetylase family protein [Anaerolineaceae bacterium]
MQSLNKPRWVLILLCLFFLSACTAPTVQAIRSTKHVQDTPTRTITVQPSATLTVSPSATSTQTLTPLPPTLTSTPVSLPLVQPAGLGYGIEPEQYVQDTCQYLYERWNTAQNSVPGTVVVPVMFHSISDRGTPSPGDTTVSTTYFKNFMDRAHQLGFETITTGQLVDFLEKNARIPPRSMILIVDDRKRASFFTTFFEPYYQKYGWTVTNAWISHPDTPAYLWKENADLIPLGFLDFQAHGVIHNIPIEPDSTDAFIHTEIYGPLTAMQEHFGKEPVAYIWPRGLFTPKAANVLQEAGYQLGFSSYPRGPLLFNWIPLGSAERQVKNPLLVLPRYWSPYAVANLDDALKISDAARAFANQNREPELNYYGKYCKGYPELK